LLDGCAGCISHLVLIGLVDFNKMLMGLIYLRKLKGPEYGKSALGEIECGPVVVERIREWGPLCVDYKELSKVTVPDKYLIPIVEELLDELHGTTYF